MIKLPKKIKETIEREFTQDFSVLNKVSIDTGYKNSNLHLILFREDISNELIILRYYGDNSYSFLAGYADMKEIREEFAFQVKKLSIF